MDMTISIRIFNRMLERFIINPKWMVKILMNIEGMLIRMSIIMVRISYQYCHLESRSFDEQGLADLGCFAFLFRSELALGCFRFLDCFGF